MWRTAAWWRAARMRRTTRMRRATAILRRKFLGHRQGWRHERKHRGNDEGATHRDYIHRWRRNIDTSKLLQRCMP
jgi:hypothetical protein